MRAMPVRKIMEIIEREQHITVKLMNRPLRDRLHSMEKDGLVELADVFRDCYYYRKAGSDWRFYTPEEIQIRRHRGEE